MNRDIKINKTLKYFGVELLYTIIMLLIMLWVKNSFGTNNMYEGPMFANIIILMIMLIWLIGPKFNRYFMIVYSSMFSLYLISQNIYLAAFGQYYRFSTALSLKNELVGVGDSVMEYIKFEHILPFIIIIAINIVFIFLFLKFQKNGLKNIIKSKYIIIFKLCSILLVIPMCLNGNQFVTQIEATKDNSDIFQINKTDYYIYEVIPNVNQFVDKFGLLTFAYRDFSSLSETELFSNDDFEEIDLFLGERVLPDDNEMTGIFKDKNVIFVQAESLMNIAVHPELTPTLYMMKEEGINVSGFNTPTTPGSTSDTEFMANTSLIPNSEGYSVVYKYPYNTYPETLATLFKRGGYKTYAYHGNYGQYYNRDVIFPTFGYDSFFSCTDLGLDSMISDSEMMDVMQWIMFEWKSNYMGFWITYSGHQPYDLSQVGVKEEYVSKIKKIYPDLSNEYIAYLAKNMDLDNSLGKFIDLLKYNERLDDFVFVVFGDHMAKGIDFSSDSSFYSETGLTPEADDQFTELYIYNSAVNHIEYDKVSTVLDFVPTFANMFGIEYDVHSILGRDIFDPNYEGFHMSESSLWETDNFKYSLIDDEYFLDSGYSKEEAEKEMNYYLHMKEISRKILKLDYFNK